MDTLQSDGRRLTLRKEYTLTSFDEGDYHTGKFPVLYVDKNIVDTLWSQDSLHIVVNTIPVDTVKQKIHDVKRPIHTPVRSESSADISRWAWPGCLWLQRSSG